MSPHSAESIDQLYTYIVFSPLTDDETAAEMLSAPLSQRKDLVDGLDADAIVDYLTHHGVLDAAQLPPLGQ